MEGRKDATCNRIAASLGEYCISCELQLAGPEFESHHTFSSLPETIAEELLNHNSSSLEVDVKITKVNKPTITIDKTLSPTHTLLQIQCIDQKGLIYDVLRMSKDCDIKVLSEFFLVSFPEDVEGLIKLGYFVSNSSLLRLVVGKISASFSTTKFGYLVNFY